MSEKTTEEKLREIVVEMTGIDPKEVKNESKFVDDIGCDSLDLVEIIMATEEEFGFDIPDDEAEKLTTFGEAVKYLEDRLASKDSVGNEGR